MTQVSVSVENAFSWTQRFAAREWPLLLPVGLTFFALPGLLVDIVLPGAMQTLLPGAALDPGLQLRALTAMLVVGLVNMVGALAVTALALVPGISVQEAIGRALRRAPTLIGALLLVTVAVLAAVLLVAVVMASLRAGPAAMQAMLVLLMVAGGAALWVRLALLTPVVVERGGAPLAALRHAWHLAAGAFWRMLGGLAVYFIGGMIVLVALHSALGAVVTLAAQALGAKPAGIVVTAVLFRLIAGVISTGFQVLVAGFYHQLAGRN